MTAEVALLARNVRRYRDERHLSLAELARRADLSKQTLSAFERGDGNPTIETVGAIAAALDVSLRALLTEWGSGVLIRRAAGAQWEEAVAGARQRPLDEVYGSGYVRSSVLTLSRQADPAPWPARSPGSLHHAYLLTGSATVGPVEDAIEIEAGDFVRFPADVEHLFAARSKSCDLHLITTYPQVPQLDPGH